MTSYYIGEVRTPKAVLVVVHDDDVRVAITTAFEDEGYIATVAENGAEGLDFLKRLADRPCIIIVDEPMPIMSGQEFLAAKQSDERLGEIPVALMSEHIHLLKTETRRAAARVFKKPVEPAELIAFARAYCD
jgi:CheY-like chemotaxis protein